ncbi:MAG: ABC transporter permease subunit [Peptococcaceae bacterium]|nr:ABC transporter permease subunit [Peptococcaceae bacterium]
MVNLLRAECYKLLRSRIFWAICAGYFLLSTLQLLDSATRTRHLFFASLYNAPILYFLVMIFCALFVGQDFSSRSVQALIAAGHSRGKLLFAKWLAYQCACSVMISLPLVVHSAIGRWMGQAAWCNGDTLFAIVIAQVAMGLLPFCFVFICHDENPWRCQWDSFS